MYSAAELETLFASRLELPPEAIKVLAEATAEFAVEVAEREREACARIADALVSLGRNPSEREAAETIAASIRERTQP